MSKSDDGCLMGVVLMLCWFASCTSCNNTEQMKREIRDLSNDIQELRQEKNP